MKGYGKELILDLHNCSTDKFNRKDIDKFFKKLCDLIDMEKEDRHFWDYEGLTEEYAAAPSHLKGISAIQFIKTSNITIHTLDDLKRAYINIFSCKDFEVYDAVSFCILWFDGEVVNEVIVHRL